MENHIFDGDFLLLYASFVKRYYTSMRQENQEMRCISGGPPRVRKSRSDNRKKVVNTNRSCVYHLVCSDEIGQKSTAGPVRSEYKQSLKEKRFPALMNRTSGRCGCKRIVYLRSEAGAVRASFVRSGRRPETAHNLAGKASLNPSDEHCTAGNEAAQPVAAAGITRFQGITNPYTSLTPSSARRVSVPFSHVKGQFSGSTALRAFRSSTSARFR